MLEISETKDNVPNTDLECPICIENIDIDEIKDYVPNCVICDNGHRMHNGCLQKSNKHECPLCRTNKMHFCKVNTRYLYAKRKG